MYIMYLIYSFSMQIYSHFAIPVDMGLHGKSKHGLIVSGVNYPRRDVHIEAQGGRPGTYENTQK